MISLNWIDKNFSDLETEELYDIVQLRQNVFIVEQENAVVEFDGDFDRKSIHILGQTSINELVAYARLLPPGLKTQHVVIGRVVTANSVRGQGVGLALLLKCVEVARHRFPTTSIELSAQTYAKGFYEKGGFKTVGEEYMEDNILHIRMVNNT